MPKRIMKCAACGSDDVWVDASARWNFEHQEWRLDSTYDAEYCEQCQGECRVTEEEV